jgi:hypothetical protein
MLGLMKMFGGMLVLRRIATANMAADQTLTQVDPGVSYLQACFAALAAGRDLANLFYVCAGALGSGHNFLPELTEPEN